MNWKNGKWYLGGILILVLILVVPDWLSHVLEDYRYLLMSFTIFGLAGYLVFGKVLGSD